MTLLQARSFDIYPAIDVLGGACVRLREGDYAEATSYSQDPTEVAHRWLKAGARFIHVVDLDGARDGVTVNQGAIEAVIAAASAAGAKVQVGGGIRSLDTIEDWLAAGAARCILGTVISDETFMREAVRAFGGERLVAGLDGRDGKLAVRGWLEQTELELLNVARRLADIGVRTAIVTDVRRDGTLSGTNIAWAREIMAQTGIGCIASGGVRDLSDIQAAHAAGLTGVIAGKALYDGRLDLVEALAVVGKEEPSC